MKICAIDVGGTSIKYAILNEKQEMLTKGKVTTPHDNRAHFLEVLSSVVPEEIDGIAISLPGLIDSNKGIAHTVGCLTYMKDEPFKKIFEEKYGVPVWIGNDAKCGALAEVGFGALRDVDDAVVIILGTGIGGCLVKDRKVHNGKQFAAGEVSSVVTRNDYPLRVENFWCMVNGVDGLLRLVQKYLEVDTYFTGEDIFELANQGKEKVLMALDEFCFNIALQLFNIQAIFDPEKIAIGGGISAQPILIEKINQQYIKLFDSSIPPFMPVPIVACEFRNDANLLGAYYQLLKQIEETNKSY